MRCTPLFILALCLLTACGSDNSDAPEGDTQPSEPTEDVSGAEEADVTPDETDTTSPTLDTTGDEDAADVPPEGPPPHPFRLSPEVSATISQAPFPANFRLGEDGKVSLPSLESDSRFATSAKPEILAMLDEIISARRGFGLANPVQFFANEAIDISSAEGNVIIATLSGPEQGRLVATRAEWSESTQALAISPAWGDYIMASSTYAVLITQGITTQGGEAVSAHPHMAMLLADAAPSDEAHAAAHSSFAALRDWLASEDSDVESDTIVVATVFTTEDVMAYGTSVFDMLDAFTLEPPTRQVSWDVEANVAIEAPIVEGDDLSTYFGVPEAPFQNNPASWTTSRRAEAASQTSDGLPYAGGQLHTGVGRVINGSVLAPAPNFQTVDGVVRNLPISWDDAGSPTWSMKAMIPFTLYLCDSHLEALSDVPVAVFTHGGTSHRSAGAAWAPLNCKLGIATLSYDTLYHGGRIMVAADEAGEILLAVNPDEDNEYTGLSIGDEGFVPDYAGDTGGGPETVGQIFALPLQLNPEIAEGNLIMMAGDTHMVTRYVKEADWSQVQPGLSFDAERVIHVGLSYGTSFTTPVLALTQDYIAEVWSVGSGAMVTSNLLSAPSNAELASGFVRFTLGLPTSADDLMATAWLDPIIGLIQWLSQRGDPLAYAPYVLRHRTDGYELPILATGDSWDETLSARAQMSFGNALGMPVYTHGDAWTLDPSQPGIDMIQSTPYGDAPLSDNATFGDRTHTAGIFYTSASCHAMQVRPMCVRNHELQYPPIVPLENSEVTDEVGLICELQSQSLSFLSSVMSSDGPTEIVAPHGDCDALYGL
ncbi:MAG: hypothetical protein ACPGU1_06540 [Myxococcota bacterium]